MYCFTMKDGFHDALLLRWAVPARTPGSLLVLKNYDFQMLMGFHLQDG